MAFCSTKRIATPFEFISLTISNTSLIATGERPADGSSNSRIFGEVVEQLGLTGDGEDVKLLVVATAED